MRVTYDTRVRPILGTLALIVTLGCALVGCGSNLPEGLNGSTDSLGSLEGWVLLAPGDNVAMPPVTGLFSLVNQQTNFSYSTPVLDASEAGAIPPPGLVGILPYGYFRITLPAGTYSGFSLYAITGVSAPSTGELVITGGPTGSLSVVPGVTGTVTAYSVYLAPEAAPAP